MVDYTSREPDSVIIKLEYDEFITAAQLSHILEGLDHLYMALLATTTDQEGLIEPDQARLRVDSCRTGRSLELVLVDGVKLVLDPATHAFIAGTASVAGLGLTVLMARVLAAVARSVAETRKLWHEGTKAREEAGKLAAEREDKAGDVLAQLPETERRTIVEIGQRLINEIEYSTNITILYVNETAILTKNGRERRTFGSSSPPD